LYLKHDEKYQNMYKFLLKKEPFIKQNINNNYQKSILHFLSYLVNNVYYPTSCHISDLIMRNFGFFVFVYRILSLYIYILARYYSSIAYYYQFFCNECFFCICCIYVLIMLSFCKIIQRYWLNRIFEKCLIIEEIVLFFRWIKLIKKRNSIDKKNFF
jgi:hypothetical protein